MIKQLSFSAIICIALTMLTPGQTNTKSVKTTRVTEKTRIEAYCQGLDAYAKNNSKLGRIFADVSSDGEDQKNQWREFESEAEREKADTGDNLNENAVVWSKAGAVVLVSSTFQSPSRDWAHFVSYYFRPDGTLAKVRARLNTFYGEMTVIRERFYDSKGRLLSSSQQFLDLKTQKKKKPGGEFQDDSFPLYRTVRALPFYSLLGKQAGK
jgi:hypothetical protein